MADADGGTCRRALHLAAGTQHRRGKAGGQGGRRLCPDTQAVPHAHRQFRRGRGGAGKDRRQYLPDGCRPVHDLLRGRPGRKAVGYLLDGQIPLYRADAADSQRRDGRHGRERHLPGAAQPPGTVLPGGANRHYRRRSQHPHPFHDHFRPRGNPLPSLPPQGDASGEGLRRSAGPGGIRPAVVRACRLCHGERGQGFLPRADGRASGESAARHGAPLFPVGCPHECGLRLRF